MAGRTRTFEKILKFEDVVKLKNFQHKGSLISSETDSNRGRPKIDPYAQYIFITHI